MARALRNVYTTYRHHPLSRYLGTWRDLVDMASYQREGTRLGREVGGHRPLDLDDQHDVRIIANLVSVDGTWL